MAEVTIYINGRSYDIACDNGQEGRIVDLAAYIDQRLQQISRTGAAYNDAHLTVLTSLVLADELFEGRSLTVRHISKIYKQELSHQTIQGQFIIARLGGPRTALKGYRAVTKGKMEDYAFSGFINAWLRDPTPVRSLF